METLTRRAFEARYRARGEPVVITGGLADWPALERWTPDYFARALGDEVVEVNVNRGGVYDDNRREPMRLGAYVDELRAGETPRNSKYFTCDVDAVLPRLRDDYRFPPHIKREEGARLHLFFGRDAKTGNHYHPWQQNTLAQIYGQKQVFLFEPGQFSRLDPEPFADDRFNFSRGDFEELARQTPHAVVELQPGEMLFIPVHWWHGVLGEGMSISAAFFWPASLEHYRFPEPGLRCIAKSPRKLAESARALVRERLGR